MASAKVFNVDGDEVGSVELADAVFGMGPNEGLVHQAAMALLNALRQGNAETRTRRMVRGGGRKPFRQKGTGNARQGSIREPQMRGGGTVFGPHKRSYRQRQPLATRRKALCCVLSDRVRGEALCVLDALRCDGPKTGPFAAMVRRLSPEGGRTLLVTAGTERDVLLSVRNLKQVTVRTAEDVNALDVLRARRVVVVQDALGKLTERLS